MKRLAFASMTLAAFGLPGCKDGGSEHRTRGVDSPRMVETVYGTSDPVVGNSNVVSVETGPPEVVEEPVAQAEMVVPDFSGEPHEWPCEAEHRVIGDGLIAAGMFPEAMTELERAVFDDPENFETRREIGELYRTRGKLENAVGHLRTAIELVEDAGTMEVLAQTYFDLKDFSAATRVIDQQRKIDPTNPEPYRILARVYMSQNMWKESIDASEEAIARGSDSPWTYNNLGFAHLILGSYEDAVRELEKAVSFDAGVTPQIWNNLGLAYEKSGKVVDAVSSYRAALAGDPTYVKAKVNLDRGVSVAKELGLAIGERKAEVDFEALGLEEVILEFEEGSLE